jgi:hypothetical protein
MPDLAEFQTLAIAAAIGLTAIVEIAAPLAVPRIAPAPPDGVRRGESGKEQDR